MDGPNDFLEFMKLVAQNPNAVHCFPASASAPRRVRMTSCPSGMPYMDGRSKSQQQQTSTASASGDNGIKGCPHNNQWPEGALVVDNNGCRRMTEKEYLEFSQLSAEAEMNRSSTSPTGAVGPTGKIKYSDLPDSQKNFSIYLKVDTSLPNGATHTAYRLITERVRNSKNIDLLDLTLEHNPFGQPILVTDEKNYELLKLADTEQQPKTSEPLSQTDLRAKNKAFLDLLKSTVQSSSESDTPEDIIVRALNAANAADAEKKKKQNDDEPKAMTLNQLFHQIAQSNPTDSNSDSTTATTEVAPKKALKKISASKIAYRQKRCEVAAARFDQALNVQSAVKSCLNVAEKMEVVPLSERIPIPQTFCASLNQLINEMLTRSLSYIQDGRYATYLKSTPMAAIQHLPIELLFLSRYRLAEFLAEHSVDYAILIEVLNAYGYVLQYFTNPDAYMLRPGTERIAPSKPFGNTILSASVFAEDAAVIHEKLKIAVEDELERRANQFVDEMFEKLQNVDACKFEIADQNDVMTCEVVEGTSVTSTPFLHQNFVLDSTVKFDKDYYGEKFGEYTRTSKRMCEKSICNRLDEKMFVDGDPEDIVPILITPNWTIGEMHFIIKVDKKNIQNGKFKFGTWVETMFRKFGGRRFTRELEDLDGSKRQAYFLETIQNGPDAVFSTQLKSFSSNLFEDLFCERKSSSSSSGKPKKMSVLVFKRDRFSDWSMTELLYFVHAVFGQHTKMHIIGRGALNPDAEDATAAETLMLTTTDQENQLSEERAQYAKDNFIGLVIDLNEAETKIDHQVQTTLLRIKSLAPTRAKLDELVATRAKFNELTDTVAKLEATPTTTTAPDTTTITTETVQLSGNESGSNSSTASTSTATSVGDMVIVSGNE